MTDYTILCFWHPHRVAKWIVNLGSPLDTDTPACNKCKETITKMKEQEYYRNATIKSIK